MAEEVHLPTAALHEKPLAKLAKTMDEILEESKNRSPLHYRLTLVMMDSRFDFVMGFIIVFNMLVLIVETDRSVDPVDDSDSGMHWTEAFSWVSLVIFCSELTMRIFVLRCTFWLDKWNLFDFLIVGIDTVFSIVGIFATDVFPTSMLRIFRLAKLGRVSKVLRVFPELRLLLAGLLGSLSAIFWGTVLLAVCLLVWAMVAVLFIHPINEEIDYGDCARCPQAYNSVMSAALTFWQQLVAGDSWGQVTIPVIEKQPLTAAFFIPMHLSVGMAVTNLILGVVVSVAQEARDELLAEDAHEKRLSKMEKQTHLIDLCKGMDPLKTGRLSKEQIYASFQNEGDFRDACMAMDISVEDMDIIWSIIDPDKKGCAQYKELVGNLYAIRNSDTQFMLAYVKYYITSIRNHLLGRMDTLQQKQQEEKDAVAKVDKDVHKLTEVDTELKAKVGGATELDQIQLLGLAMPKASIDGHPCTTTTIEATETWLAQVNQDIAAWQAQLQSIVMDVERKLEAQVSAVSSMSKGLSNADPHRAPMVAADGHVSQSCAPQGSVKLQSNPVELTSRQPPESSMYLPPSRASPQTTSTPSSTGRPRKIAAI